MQPPAAPRTPEFCFSNVAVALMAAVVSAEVGAELDVKTDEGVVISVSVTF